MKVSRPKEKKKEIETALHFFQKVLYHVPDNKCLFARSLCLFTMQQSRHVILRLQRNCLRQDIHQLCKPTSVSWTKVNYIGGGVCSVLCEWSPHPIPFPTPSPLSAQLGELNRFGAFTSGVRCKLCSCWKRHQGGNNCVFPTASEGKKKSVCQILIQTDIEVHISKLQKCRETLDWKKINCRSLYFVWLCILSPTPTFLSPTAPSTSLPPVLLISLSLSFSR